MYATRYDLMINRFLFKLSFGMISEFFEFLKINGVFFKIPNIPYRLKLNHKFNL